MSLERVTRNDWIVGGVALLLVIDLLVFPWFSFGAGGFSFDLTGTDAPDGWLGVLAMLAAVAVVADLAVERFSPQTQVPAIRASRAMTRFVLAAAAAILMALKFLFNIHFSDFGWGFYLGVVLIVVLVLRTMQARNAESTVSAAPAGPVA